MSIKKKIIVILDTLIVQTTNLTVTQHSEGIKTWVQQKKKLQLEEESLVPTHVVHALRDHFRNVFSI